MNRIKHYFSIVMMLFFITAFQAQTPEQRDQIIANYDLNKLAQLEADALEEHQRRRAEALALAAAYGWPESYSFEDGGVGFLIDVIDGQPVYLETLNRTGGITIRANHLHTGGSLGLDVNGQDMKVGVWDGGRVRQTHQLFEGRTSHNDGETQTSSHATHVTGTVIGSGEFQNGNAKGNAHQAESLNYSFRVGNDGAEVLAAIANHGLLVSNHSYGVPPDGGNGPALPAYVLGKYTGSSRLWDQIHHMSPYYLSVWAAGNARNTQHNNLHKGGYDILTNQAVSKNTLVVGAVFQVLNYNGPSNVNMSSFSSWGPTDDGRVKPDVVAKGVNVFSSTSASNASYANFSGTSMAAPGAAGAAILLQQHYYDLNNKFMRSSTLRGLIIHTADEAGAAPGPDFRFGWGLMNTKRAAEIISEDGTTSHIFQYKLLDGESIEITGTAVPGERLVASITWTDVQGTSVPGTEEDDDTPMLVNDLDLRVIDENNEMHMPWIIEFDHSDPSTYANPATKGDNFRDNVEKIEIDEPSGDYTIIISHKGELEGGEQRVSVIITGLDNVDAPLTVSRVNDVVASIFPNPANNELNVHALTEISQIEILNMLGQSLGLQSVNAKNTKIDISHLKQGTYFIRVSIDNASKVYKFIKR